MSTAPRRLAAGTALLVPYRSTTPLLYKPPPNAKWRRRIVADARELPQPRITDHDVATYVAGSRRAEEAAANARILSRQQSPAARASMREKLADHNIIFHSASDPIVVDDLAVINQIRLLDQLATAVDIQTLRLQVGDSPFLEQRVVVRQPSPG